MRQESWPPFWRCRWSWHAPASDVDERVELSKKRADLAKEIGKLNQSLAEEMKRDASAQAALATKEKRDREAAATKAKRDREAAERKRNDERRSDDRRRQQERLEDEQRRRLEQWERQRRREQDRLDDLQKTESMIGASEQRLGKQIEAIRAPKKEQLRILYATASSRGDLRVDEEIRRVKAVVNASTNRDQVRIEHLPAATTSDLLDGLTSFRPHVVHFSGHADEKVLVFDDGGDTMGPGHTVTAQTFKSAVEAPDEPPMLVVLNACKSADQLEALLGKVPLGIGMSDSIGDVDALTFSTRGSTPSLTSWSVSPICHRRAGRTSAGCEQFSTRSTRCEGLRHVSSTIGR